MQVGTLDGWPWGAACTAASARRALRVKRREYIFWGVGKKANTKDGGCREPHFIIRTLCLSSGRFLDLICRENSRDKLPNLFESPLVKQKSTVSENTNHIK